MKNDGALRRPRHPGGGCRRFRFGTALIGIAAVLASCGRVQPEQPAELELIRFLEPSPIPSTFAADLVARFDAALPVARVSLNGTSGSLSLVSALERGRGDIGIAQSDIVYLAYRRGLESYRVPHTNLRGIAVLWVNAVQIMVRGDSTSQSLRDFHGQRVGVGPVGSAGEFFARTVLEAYGLGYPDIEERHHPVSRMPMALLDGALDGAIAVSLVDRSSLATSSRLRLLSIDPNVISQLRSRYLFAKPLFLPAHMSDANISDVHTVGIDALLVCHRDLEEDVVYRLVREFFAMLPDLALSHAAASLVDPDLGPTTPIPLHPGAARYYREREILG